MRLFSLGNLKVAKILSSVANCLCIITNVINNKNELWKTVSLTSFLKNRFQCSPSLSVQAYFVFVPLFIPSFMAFSGSSFCFTLSAINSNGLNFERFCHTAPLSFWTCTWRCLSFRDAT